MSQPDTLYGDVYAHVWRMAWEETGLPPTTFPDTCPWTMAQALETEFWPEEAR